MTDQLPPSAFAALGNPSCSCWGKSEIEWVAHAYVRALQLTGDTWRRMTREEVYAAIPTDEYCPARSLLERDWYQHWFDAVAERITDEEGAWSVGGFWSPHRMERLKQSLNGDAKP